MRSVKVTLPQRFAERVKQLAFESGVKGVNVSTVKYFSKDGKEEEKSSVSFETSTPKAKIFIDKTLSSDIFDPKEWSLSSRERKAIVGSEPIEEVTYPWVAPGVDVCQELFLFSHVTIGFVGRVFLAGCLLSYGLLSANLLLMIAGMMFLPLLPIMSGIGFSSWIRQWGFAGRAVLALIVSLGLLFVSGALVGSISDPPVKFSDFEPMPVSIAISIAVGLASGLGMTDDGGRREMIGLAATAQIAIIPSWLGLVLMHGIPAGSTAGDVEKRILMLFLNIICVVVGSLVVYVATKTAHSSLSHLNSK